MNLPTFIIEFFDSIDFLNLLTGLVGWQLRASFVIVITLVASKLALKSSRPMSGLILRTATVWLLIMPLMVIILPRWETGILTQSMQYMYSVSSQVAQSALFWPEIHVSAGGTLAGVAIVTPEQFWAFWPVTLFCLGIIFLIVRTSLGYVRAIGIRNTARPINDSQFKTQYRLLLDRLGIVGEEISVVESDRIVIPYASGLIHPSIVLPSFWREWSLERLEATLVHELTHIRRHDVALLLLVTAVRILYWINPLIRIALGQLRKDIEFTSDTAVLRSGASPSMYARHLLSMASLASERIAVVTETSLLGKSHMEERLMQILKKEKTPAPAGRISSWLRLTLLSLFALVFVVATMLGGSTVANDAAIVPSSQSDLKEELPSPDKFVKIDKMPEMLKYEPPIYPDSAKNHKIEGNVGIQVLVDKTGKIIDVRVNKTSGHEILDNAAEAAAWKILMTPGKQDDKPVACWITYFVNFVLDDEEK